MSNVRWYFTSDESIFKKSTCHTYVRYPKKWFYEDSHTCEYVVDLSVNEQDGSILE